MRSISDALIDEQKKPTRRPLVKVEVQAYGHPQKAASIQWRTFAWERLYQGSETKSYHSMCLAGDGSLNRVRLDGTTIKHSRVTSPGPSSDFSQWTNRGNTVASSHLAIAAHGAEVIIVAAGTAYTWRLQSSDYGATWGSWVSMPNTRPCERGCAIAYKPNGDCAIVHASDVNDPTSLYIQTRTSGAWSSGYGQRTGDWDIEGLAMYYDGDWNIIALVLEGSNLIAYRMVYGCGYRVAAGTWADDVKIGLARAHVEVDYMLALRQFGSQWYGGSGARQKPPPRAQI